MRRGPALVLAVLLLAVGCATDPTDSGAPPAVDPEAPATSTTGPASVTPAAPSAPSDSSSAPSSVAPQVQTTAPDATLPPPSGTATPPTTAATTPSTSPEDASSPFLAEEDCAVPDRFLGKDLERLPVTDKVVALTFDAGANADAVRPILDTLAARDVPGTFFLTGRFVEAFPARSARIARRHLVGNHTMDHLDLTTLTDLRVRRQIRRAEAAILETTAEDPRRFFRFPFGARDARTIGLANELCYVPFRWTVDTLGWKGTSGGMTKAKVVQRVLDAAAPGAIVLMHVGSNPDDGSTLDADALPVVIRELREQGYGFARLSRVLAPAP